jgi:hypothetical protein
MAPQRTAEDLRNPLFATSCASGRKIRRGSGALFTGGVESATINHNNLDTCALPALISGTQRDGFESKFLLRVRRGSEAGRHTGTDCLSRATRGPNYPFPMRHMRSFVLHQAIADLGPSRQRLLAPHTGGRNQ